MSEPTPAVAYYRMSTNRQEQSIPEQMEAVRRYAGKNGYRIIREYDGDAGISGDDTERRRDFQRMIRDAGEKQDFQVILCWDQDRFGRFDPLEAGYWIKPLRDAGVRLETIAQGKIDWNSFGGRLQYTVQQEGKQQFLIDGSRNTLRGLLTVARQGFWLGGPPPYGYALEDTGRGPKGHSKRLVPGDPKEIEVVRWLFRTYARQDVSLRGLADELHRRGVPAPRGGKHWFRMSIRGLLANRLYVGDLVWNRKPKKGSYHRVSKDGEIIPRTRGPKRRRKANPEAEWLVFEQTHEPLIDRETFEAVQAKLAANQHRGKAYGSWDAWPLSGLVICGHCGYRMSGQSQALATADRKYRRYRCNGYTSKGKSVCHPHSIHEGRLLRCVVRKIQEEFLNPDNLEKLRAEIRRQAGEVGSASRAAAPRLRSEIAALDRKIDKGSEQLLKVPDDLMADAAAKLREWKEKRGKLQGQLEALENPPDVEVLEEKVAAAEAQLWRLRDALGDADAADLRAVLHEVVSKIELRWDCARAKVTKGGRRRCPLLRGIIYLRPDQQTDRTVVACGTSVIPSC
jgi:site-specific DNA recombinase